MGNMWTSPLSALVRNYNPAEHLIAVPILRGGPVRLAREFGFDASGRFVDECHLCYSVRKSLASRFPVWLGLREVYGLVRHTA
jgi:hypothetical protein